MKGDIIFMFMHYRSGDAIEYFKMKPLKGGLRTPLEGGVYMNLFQIRGQDIHVFAYAIGGDITSAGLYDSALYLTVGHQSYFRVGLI